MARRRVKSHSQSGFSLACVVLNALAAVFHHVLSDDRASASILEIGNLKLRYYVSQCGNEHKFKRSESKDVWGKCSMMLAVAGMQMFEFY